MHDSLRNSQSVAADLLESAKAGLMSATAAMVIVPPESWNKDDPAKLIQLQVEYLERRRWKKVSKKDQNHYYTFRELLGSVFGDDNPPQPPAPTWEEIVAKCWISRIDCLDMIGDHDEEAAHNATILPSNVIDGVKALKKELDEIRDKLSDQILNTIDPAILAKLPLPSSLDKSKLPEETKQKLEEINRNTQMTWWERTNKFHRFIESLPEDQLSMI
ncbi:hypothetical protein DdX_13087 [Ditylenchus destructor]|uniref:Uncharacterized protein n=1 Tax=Ditylenchus destructor TaxID=166010 RepID=A0AAD4QZS1_9BILA|nr:hypothetical protein DdX_13087 [Ditylenchus destructor]